MLKSVVVVVGHALALARAQCTLPADLPEDTQFAAGNPAECVLGGTLDGEGQGPCVIECVAGQSQAAAGTYEYSCTGADLTEPAPQCEACVENTYGPTPGLETCTPCPENSGTDGATGATAVGACLCNAGYQGTLATPEDSCEACPVGTWLGIVGAGPCTPCTPGAVTEATASTAITDCLCGPGHTGDIAGAEDTCDECALGTYKGGNGPAACDACPEFSITEQTASTLVTDCLCSPGHTGDIAAPEDTCEACVENTYKEDNGPADCTDCPENSNTNGQTGSTEPMACECEDGFVGVISGPNDTCRTPGSLGAGAIVGISAAAVVGVAAAFGGIMYGKGAYERGRRYSVQQDRNDPLMPGGSNA